MLEPRPPSVAAKQAAETPAAAPGAPGESEGTDAVAADVARAVRELRAGSGLSERAAARLLGTSQTQLRRMEDPRYLPSLRSLARVAAAYGHRLRIAFEPRDRPAVKPAKPAAPRPRPAARPRRAAGGRPKAGRARRHA